MMEQKFKVGDRVRDTFTGKTGTITAVFWDEGDELNKAEWAYSLDFLGFYYIGESDLTLI